MSDMFFYQEHGKTVGPFNADAIKERIQDGRIRVFDLLYKDGEPSWRMALEHSTLRGEFKTATLASLKDRPWVCLQKKAQGTVEFITTGPFTQDEIFAALQAGTISYSDYAWKDSLAEWKRIGSLEEFNPRARNVVLPTVPGVPQESSLDLLKNVVEFQRPLPVHPFVEEVPPEAEVHRAPPSAASPVTVKSAKSGKVSKGAEPVMPTVEPETVTRSVNLPPPTPVPRATRAANPIRIHGESKPIAADEAESAKPRPWFDWGLVGVLVIVLVAVVLIVSRFLLPHVSVNLPEQNTAAVQEAPVVAPPAPPSLPVTPETAKPEPAPEPQVETPVPPHAPQELILAVHANGAGGQPQIELRSDGTAEYPVYLQIVGLPGQVSEGGAFYRFMRINPRGKLKEPLEIPAFKLPQGKFIVRAETGEFKKETKFTWGLNEPQFKSTMARQRKTWAYALWKERLNLFVLSQALEKQVTQALVPGKKFPAPKWESLIALKRGDGSKYLMFEEWWELHNIAKEAKSGVTGSLATRAQKERDHLSTFSVWK